MSLLTYVVHNIGLDRSVYLMTTHAYSMHACVHACKFVFMIVYACLWHACLTDGRMGRSVCFRCLVRLFTHARVPASSCLRTGTHMRNHIEASSCTSTHAVARSHGLSYVCFHLSLIYIYIHTYIHTHIHIIYKHKYKYTYNYTYKYKQYMYIYIYIYTQSPGRDPRLRRPQVCRLPSLLPEERDLISLCYTTSYYIICVIIIIIIIIITTIIVVSCCYLFIMSLPEERDRPPSLNPKPVGTFRGPLFIGAPSL